MAENPQLDQAFVHDVNADLVMPFDDVSFDAVSDHRHDPVRYQVGGGLSVGEPSAQGRK